MVYTSASVIVGCLDRVDSSADTRSSRLMSKKSEAMWLTRTCIHLWARTRSACMSGKVAMTNARRRVVTAVKQTRRQRWWRWARAWTRWCRWQSGCA